VIAYTSRAVSADHSLLFVTYRRDEFRLKKIAENRAAAAIDISDGLAAELGHLSAASRVGISVRIEDIPTVSGMSPLEAAGSGEEYELVVTSPADIDTKEFTTRFGLDITQIGAVTGGAIGVVMTQDGEPVVSPAGYLHFTE